MLCGGPLSVFFYLHGEFGLEPGPAVPGTVENSMPVLGGGQWHLGASLYLGHETSPSPFLSLMYFTYAWPSKNGPWPQ